MKSIGIITMHRPLSYGSALQAFALQYSIEKLGYKSELIDYQYPNSFHRKDLNKVSLFIEESLSMARHAFFGFPNITKKKKFKKFRNSFFKLSDYYPTESSLYKAPPLYDAYFTGSDQVWNATFTKGDSSFLLGFTDSLEKYSYASSFAIKELPDNQKKMFADNLKKYKQITVREKEALKIVHNLTGMDAVEVCDPTVLLNADEWDIIANQSSLKLPANYILVFMLRYSFDPYPQARSIIEGIQQKLNLPIIFLDGNQEDYFKKNAHVIKDAGPSDFLYIIKNATYVITDSFHGTVFSTIYNRPLTAIIKKGHKDSRIYSYLKRINWSESGVYHDSSDNELKQPSGCDGIDEFRKDSINILKQMLKNV